MEDDMKPTDMDYAMKSPTFQPNVLHAPEGSSGSLSNPVADIDSATTDCDVNHNSESYKRERDQFFRILPTGYRFCPTDEELLHTYLQRKVENRTLPFNKIADENVYMNNPEVLAAKYEQAGEKDLYFFTPRYRKYQNGKRPKRATEGGYWKACGADKPVQSNGMIIGFKKALVFYVGKPQKGEKTNWIMHEYRVANAPPPSKTDANDMKLDDWVLCRIYKKGRKPAVRHQDEDPMLGTSAPGTATSGSATSTPGTSAPRISAPGKSGPGTSTPSDFVNENHGKEISCDPSVANANFATQKQNGYFRSDKSGNSLAMDSFVYPFHERHCCGGTPVQQRSTFDAATSNQFHEGKAYCGPPFQQRLNPEAATSNGFHEGNACGGTPVQHRSTFDVPTANQFHERNAYGEIPFQQRLNSDTATSNGFHEGNACGEISFQQRSTFDVPTANQFHEGNAYGEIPFQQRLNSDAATSNGFHEGNACGGTPVQQRSTFGVPTANQFHEGNAYGGIPFQQRSTFGTATANHLIEGNAYGGTPVQQRSSFYPATGNQFYRGIACGGMPVQQQNDAITDRLLRVGTPVQQQPTFRATTDDQFHRGGTPVQQQPTFQATTDDQLHEGGTPVQQQSTLHATTNGQLHEADARIDTAPADGSYMQWNS